MPKGEILSSLAKVVYYYLLYILLNFLGYFLQGTASCHKLPVERECEYSSEYSSEYPLLWLCSVYLLKLSLYLLVALSAAGPETKAGREVGTDEDGEYLLLYVCHQPGSQVTPASFPAHKGTRTHSYVSQLNLHCRTSSSAYLAHLSVSLSPSLCVGVRFFIFYSC